MEEHLLPTCVIVITTPSQVDYAIAKAASSLSI
jgi:hypothetical protein